ncbi:MAG: hypothetical protein KJ069_14925 [Anaerolineae bacterium]|nr:hypothetical protein [Anaerolineae bacterium]
MKNREFFLLFSALLALSFALSNIYIARAVAGVSYGGQWVVDRLDDPALPGGAACTDAPGDCSLRGAVSVYNPGDQITFAVTGTLTLTNDEILITNGDVMIQGPGADDLIISAGDASRIFTISPGQHVHIAGVTLRDGFASQGGAIFNNLSTLTLADCTLTENTASEYGGAIQNSAATPSRRPNGAPAGGGLAAHLLIHNCVLSDNAASGIEQDERLGGDPTGVGGAIYNAAVGAGATAVVTITHSTLTDNMAADDFYAGGAITNFSLAFNGGGNTHVSMHIADSIITNNTAPNGDGGAIASYALDAGAMTTVSILNSTVSGNTSGSDFGGGGGIFSFAYNRDPDGLTEATLNLIGSTFAGNVATMDRGGAVFNGALDSGSTAVTHILNSTFSGNTALDTGGAIANDAYNRDTVAQTNATIFITHASFVGNSAGSGGAISNVPVNQNGTVTEIHLQNSLLHNSSGSDCQNSGVMDGANNLIDDTTCGSEASFRLGAPALVSLTLADNGGPTHTHALLAGTNAEDAVPDGECTVVNTSIIVDADQRGEARPVGATCDVGAVEGVMASFSFGIYLPVIIK